MSGNCCRFRVTGRNELISVLSNIEEDEVNTERGTITKIEIDVEYPSGVRKHVTLSDDPNDAEHNHYMISEVAGLYFGKDDLVDFMAHTPEVIETENIRAKWNVMKDGDSYYPAMVMLKKDGTALVMCGGHNNGPHPVRRQVREAAVGRV